MLNIGGALVVQNEGLAVVTDLQTHQVLLVRARFGSIRVTVEDHIFVTCEELLFSFLCVDHGWSEIGLVGVKATWVVVHMERANLEVKALEVCFATTFVLDPIQPDL